LRKNINDILLALTAAERRQFWVLIALNIFISIADIGALAFLLFVINFYINNADAEIFNLLPHWMLDRGSAILIAVFFILFGIKNMLGIFISTSQYKFISRVAVRISESKLENYQKDGFEKFVEIDSSELIRKIAFQPFEFCQHILSGIQQIIIQSVLILLTVAAILLYNVKLFLLLFLILLPPVTLVFFFIKKKITAAKKNIHASNERSFRFLLDALKGYVEGNIYQRNDFFFHRFSNARQIFSKYLFDSLSIQTMPNRIIETFAILGLFILILIAKWSGVNDNSTLITIGAFMAGAYKIIPGIVKIINAGGQMRAYEFSFTDIIPDPNKAEVEKKVADNFIHSIQMKNINFQYGENAVLNNFSLTVKKGDFIGITGKSGKGKTTTLNLLLGFLSPVRGEIMINDYPVSPKEIKNYWPDIAYVRQQSFLIHDTILRNIILTEDEPDKAKLDQAIKFSGIKDFIESFPEKLDKMITENGKNISGGQQQRITIARALYKNADLILLDEPFNELDEASTAALVNHFYELVASGKMVIMITHDSKSLSCCNKIISLDEQ